MQQENTTVAVISRNSLQLNHLVASRAGISYDSGVTDEQLFVKAGALLTERRSREWPTREKFKQATGTRLNERTMKEIEKGRPGQVASLIEYCRAVGWPLVDVMRTALATKKAPAPPTPEQKRIAQLIAELDDQETALKVLRALVAFQGAETGVHE
jgi:hypothetical protein